MQKVQTKRNKKIKKMKIEGYEEISEEEYGELPRDEKFRLIAGIYKETSYFKKVQKFPIVFEDDEFKIEVENKGIDIKYKRTNNMVFFSYNESFPLLVKAVEKAKEVMNKNV